MAVTAFPRAVLVTGANRGLGLEIVKQLMAGSPAPEFIFATHRSSLGTENTGNLEALAKENSSVRLLQLDVTDDGGIRRVADTVEKVVGEYGLNLLISNSGLNDAAARHVSLAAGDITSALLLEHMAVNGVAPVMLTQAFLPLLRRAADRNASQALSCRRAAVVHIASFMASVAMTSDSERFQAVTNPGRRSYAYRGSKTALNMLARLMSYELLPLGVLSLLVHPGWVKTDMGGPAGDLDAPDSVRGVLEQVTKLDESRNGAYVNQAGEVLPW